MKCITRLPPDHHYGECMDIDTVHALNTKQTSKASTSAVIISHGANQVNATRDATRHAEVVAIDRMLSGAVSTDLLRLPQNMLLKKNNNGTNNIADNDGEEDGKNFEGTATSASAKSSAFNDAWVNVPDDPNHWKNKYGWGSGRVYKKSILSQCDLYVTCEPCIMVSCLSCSLNRLRNITK